MIYEEFPISLNGQLEVTLEARITEPLAAVLPHAAL